MNYQKIYDSLMSKARTRQLEPGFYFERHHVVPRCLGGTDDIENLVKLTAEEHYVAHQLLVKLNPGHRGLAYAVQLMTTHHANVRTTNKLYGWVRKKLSGHKHTIESRKKMSEARRRKIYSEEDRKKMSLGQKKRYESEEERKKVSNQHKGKTISEEQRKKLSEAGKGRITSEETKEKMRQAWIKRKERDKKTKCHSDSMYR